MKICIVTPDLSGPMTNGGIGTAVAFLAKFGSLELKLEVDVLYTGEVANYNSIYWKEFFSKNYNIGFYSQEDLPQLPKEPILDSLWVNTRSMQVYEWLRNRDYQQIHFQDYQANAYISIQAKYAGLSFSNTLLTCTTHSSIEWMKEGNECFAVRTIEEIVQQYMEHYCVSNADILISPSHYMLEWIKTKVKKLPPVRVIQNLYHDKPSHSFAHGDVKELCFFGRLETRKGLEIFTGALEGLVSCLGLDKIPKITFLGRPGNMSTGQNPMTYLHEFSKKTGIEISIKENFSAEKAISYLKTSPGIVAVLPSKMDNLPYVVLECLQEGIPFIASRVGGVPELVQNSDNLFDPSERGLLHKILQILKHGIACSESGYDLVAAKKGWADIFSIRPSPGNLTFLPSGHNVTICIPYYNYPDYLPELLSSLEAQTVSGFKVIVVNDGSTDLNAQAVFKNMEALYGSTHGWEFVTTENQGICSARNYAASLAKSKYLIFMDADNIAEPDMVKTFLEAIESSGLDCFTCYATYFNEKDPSKTLCHYRPVGPCLAAGLYYNIFGDATFIIKKEIFEKLNGFHSIGKVSFEDWEFLANLTLSGYSIDVIPKQLFKYRFTSGGFSRNTSLYKNFRRIIDRYSLHVPFWARPLLLETYSAMRSEVFKAFPPPNIAPVFAIRVKNRLMNYYRIEHAGGIPRISLRVPLPSGVIPCIQKIRKIINRYF